MILDSGIYICAMTPSAPMHSYKWKAKAATTDKDGPYSQLIGTVEGRLFRCSCSERTHSGVLHNPMRDALFSDDVQQ